MADARTPAIDSFERMLASGKDGALLRFALGNEYLKLEAPEQAAAHLARALAFDPAYTAAWKLYGKALATLGRDAEALAAYRSGIAAAAARGDMQAQKEMQVFARRLEKAADAAPPPDAIT